MTSEAAPRTAAGRALHRDLVNSQTCSSFDAEHARRGILAIEAEAAAGTALDERLRRFAELVAETSNDPHLVAEAEHILARFAGVEGA